MGLLGSSRSSVHCNGATEELDDAVVEIDPSKRYVRYKEEMGRGSFKTVYKAFDQVDGVEVAWNQIDIRKVLGTCSSLENLHSEISLLKHLRHDKIVKLLKSWVDEKKMKLNIITELFTSGSLRQYLEKHKKVNIKALKGWARQILLGLEYLHSLKPPVIHRDLKCDNIFINGNHGEVKIGDLGLATILQQSSALGAHGTLEFMAPEIYKNETYNELVDIYSFGMCLLEMATFDYPYSECKSHGEIYRKVYNGKKPAALSKVQDPELKVFIEKCLVPAAKRLSAKELLKDPFLSVPENVSQATISRINQINNHSAPPVDLGSKIRRSSSNCNNFNAANPPIIYVVKHSGDHGSYSALEARKRMEDIELKLQGRLLDKKSIHLTLHIKDGHVSHRTLDFPFDLTSDTALSIASEMAEEGVEIAAQNVEIITEMIDSLLIIMVDGWEPCVSVNPQVIGGPLASRASEHYTNSKASFQNSGSSRSDSIPMHLTNGMKLDAASLAQRNDKKSHNGRSSCARMDCNDYIANTTVKSSRKLYEKDVHTDGASLNTMDVNDEDDILKLELERIELQYRQAIEDMLVMRQKAVSEARHRASQRKLLGVH